MKFNKLKLNKFQFAFLILGLVLGLTIGLLVKQKELTYKSPIVNGNDWQTSSLHFEFKYPKGWHVFSDGEKFTMDRNPIYYFPHQSYKVIEGETIDNDVEEINNLQKSGFIKVTLPISSQMNNKNNCFENSRKDTPDGPFPTLDGQIVCIATIPWNTYSSITYKLTGNDTNNKENRAVYLKFIESIKPVELLN